MLFRSDLGDRLAGEMPEMLVGAIRAALRGHGGPARDEQAARVQALRESVPPEHRARFEARQGHE